MIKLKNFFTFNSFFFFWKAVHPFRKADFVDWICWIVQVSICFKNLSHNWLELGNDVGKWVELVWVTFSFCYVRGLSLRALPSWLRVAGDWPRALLVRVDWQIKSRLVAPEAVASRQKHARARHELCHLSQRAQIWIKKTFEITALE